MSALFRPIWSKVARGGLSDPPSLSTGYIASELFFKNYLTETFFVSEYSFNSSRDCGDKAHQCASGPDGDVVEARFATECSATGPGAQRNPDLDAKDADLSVRSLMRAGLEVHLRWYHRHEVQIDAAVPEPALIVSNHGFGGMVDLNVLAMFAVHRDVALRRPTTTCWSFLAGTSMPRRRGGIATV